MNTVPSPRYHISGQGYRCLHFSSLSNTQKGLTHVQCPVVLSDDHSLAGACMLHLFSIIARLCSCISLEIAGLKYMGLALFARRCICVAAAIFIPSTGEIVGLLDRTTKQPI
jgi:hypothetical protein